MAKIATAETDVILIGAGIMSATLGMMIRELEPGASIRIFERLDVAAAESSDAWNNAGTGHSAFCELNYTPLKEDGTVDISKAISIAESFEESRQFWAYLIGKRVIELPESFIRSIPHMSFVQGKEDIGYLKKRYEALVKCHLFKDMVYSEDPDQISSWIPLMMKGRHRKEVAATRMDLGTDVNFGSLTRSIFRSLEKNETIKLFFHTQVVSLKKIHDGRWRVHVRDLNTHKSRYIVARFVFIGAGGGALPLLLKSRIEEAKGFGGFPVSGQWLRCTNQHIIEQHHAKVYGRASVGAPPMSVPHLDTRFIKGRQELLYGPFAGFTTRFLKKGSVFDLIRSIRISNIWPMLAAGFHNIPLTRYLIEQVKLNSDERLAELRKFLPEAKGEDWEIEIAGQRVQVIKKDEEEGGILEFGTEVVSGAGGSIAALLGASPGASTAVSIMIRLLSQCFPDRFQSSDWQEKFKQMIPSFGQSLSQHPELLKEVRKHTSDVLRLYNPQ